MSRFGGVLGLALSDREIGLGLLCSGELVRAVVVTLRSKPTPDDKFAHFTATIAGLLGKSPVTRLTVVSASGGRWTPLMRQMRSWLREQAAHRAITMQCHDLADVKASLVGERGPATNRGLAMVLSNRFPRLRHRMPKAKRAFVSSKETYWNRVFQAVGAAVYDENTLIHDGDSPLAYEREHYASNHSS